MKVFVAGATGAIGRPLIRQLLEKGHSVVALTRSPEKAQALMEQGVEAVVADVFDADALLKIMSNTQPEVVIEQLTALPKVYTKEAMQAAAVAYDRVRLEGGANVLAAAQAVGVRRYIIQSTAFWSAPGVGLANEETLLACDPSSTLASGSYIVNKIEHRLLQTPKLEGIVLRYGFFYGPGSWYASDGYVAMQVRQQQFPIIGNGEGVWSWIHVEDGAQATVAAVEQGNPGIYLVADEQPSAVNIWLPAYARWLNAPLPAHVTVEEALATAGEIAVYYATQLRGVSNAKAKRELGIQPRPLEWLVNTAVAQTNRLLIL